MTLLIGGHAPVQGFSERGRAAAEILGPQIMLWTPACGPRDAARYPDCVHLLRCRNWGAQEDADAYANSLSDYVTPWRSAIPGAVLVLGNEPDLESGHRGERIGQMAAAVKRRFPGVKVGNPPLSVEAIGRTKADGCDVICCHTYWGFEAPSYLTDPRWGRNYLPLLGAQPVFVTEVNASPANLDPATNWTERNRQIAQWIGQAEHDGVAGACLFILDAAPDWASFDVGPEAATDILAQYRQGAPQAPPRPEPPPPEEQPTMYTRDSDPRGYRPLHPGWRPFLAAHNPEEADVICNAYEEGCRVIGYDANCAVAQGCVETAVFTSPRWCNAHNAAGIGIYADSTPDVQFGDARRGVLAQVELLSNYFGDGSEPWRILHGFGFGGMRLGKTTLRGLDGVWAADTGYSRAIVGYLAQVTGGDQPTPAPTPPPVPVARQFSIVTPVDDPVLQGSDGAYSHAGNSPGFFALDYGCAIGTPIRAAADGRVGMIYWRDSNPISLRTGHSVWIDHDNGYSTFSCHMTSCYVETGDRVEQGEIIGTTGDPASQPGNGYGDGPHMHWEIWDTASHLRVKMEDLEAAGIAGPWGGNAPAVVEDKTDMKIETTFDSGDLKRLWDGPKTAAQKKAMPFNEGFGIEQAWAAELRAGKPLGFTISKEESDTASGRVVRYFSNGKVTYLPNEPDEAQRVKIN